MRVCFTIRAMERMELNLSIFKLCTEFKCLFYIGKATIKSMKIKFLLHLRTIAMWPLNCFSLYVTMSISIANSISLYSFSIFVSLDFLQYDDVRCSGKNCFHSSECFQNSMRFGINSNHFFSLCALSCFCFFFRNIPTFNHVI